MRFFRKRQTDPLAEKEDDRDKEAELIQAEHRANSLLERAMELHTLVTRRDQENHWQQAVNKLFSGGKA
jgi:hypothetical protein